MNDLTIHCGKVTDTLEELKHLCKAEAEKAILTLDMRNNDVISIPFWTSDFPELICVGKFQKNQDGTITYKLDFSESTL